MKYRKKPIVIDAIQYLRDANIHQVMDFFGNDKSLKYNDKDNEYYIDTLEGLMKLTAGDWVIKGVNGEFYPCKPDIFAKTYESVP